jgi:hypothetical protein
MRLGKVVKSNSHCDYVVQIDDAVDTHEPPQPDHYGFGSFVRLHGGPTADYRDRHWAVGIVYNTQLLNPAFMSMGPRLSSEPDPLFTPDLITETRTLLSTVLVGVLTQNDQGLDYGIHGIPPVVVPVHTPVYTLTEAELYQFHLNAEQRPQFCYYSHLLKSGGSFASELMQQVLGQLIASQRFAGADQRALEILRKELSWKSTMASMR